MDKFTGLYFLVTLFVCVIQSCEPRSNDCKVNCDTIINSTCSGDHCICPKENPVFVNKTDEKKCLPAVSYGDECEISEQCTFLDNRTYCFKKKCKCVKYWILHPDKHICVHEDSMRKPWKKYVPVMFGTGIAGAIIITLSVYIYRLKHRRDKIKKASASLELDARSNQNTQKNVKINVASTPQIVKM